MAHKRLIFMLICLAFFLSSCASVGLPVTDAAPSVTYPPAEVSYVAPIGDAALDYTDSVTLYLPSHNGIGLTSIETDVTFSLVRPAAETVMRTLLRQPDRAAEMSSARHIGVSLIRRIRSPSRRPAFLAFSPNS